MSGSVLLCLYFRCKYPCVGPTQPGKELFEGHVRNQRDLSYPICRVIEAFHWYSHMSYIWSSTSLYKVPDTWVMTIFAENDGDASKATDIDNTLWNQMAWQGAWRRPSLGRDHRVYHALNCYWANTNTNTNTNIVICKNTRPFDIWYLWNIRPFDICKKIFALLIFDVC